MRVWREARKDRQVMEKRERGIKLREMRDRKEKKDEWKEESGMEGKGQGTEFSKDRS